MTYSEAIKKLRNKLILTQTEFGELFGVSFATVNRWEAGKFKPTTKLKRKQKTAGNTLKLSSLGLS